MIEQRKINILYVEDQKEHIRGVESDLASFPLYEVKGLTSLEEARQELRVNPPDILLLDLGFGMPPRIEESIKFLNEVRKTLPQIKVVIYSAIHYLSHFTIYAALDAGISYLVKEDNWMGEELDRAFRTILAGGVVYSQAVVKHFKDLLMGRKPSSLTKRELEVAECIHRGLTNPQIAEELHIAVPGVRDHVSNIMSKLNFSRRAEIAVWFEKTYPHGLPNSDD